MVISVIAVLSTILFFGIRGAQAAARDVQRMQMMKGVQNALEMYKGNSGHYPMAGDAVPGGSSLCCNNFFNGMMTGLSQNNYLSNLVTTWKDPSNGLVYSGFNGGERMGYLSGWQYEEGPSECGASNAYYNDYFTGSSVRYGYYTPDGQSYILCLVKEGGGFSTFKSPQ